MATFTVVLSYCRIGVSHDALTCGGIFWGAMLLHFASPRSRNATPRYEVECMARGARRTEMRNAMRNARRVCATRKARQRHVRLRKTYPTRKARWWIVCRTFECAEHAKMLNWIVCTLQSHGFTTYLLYNTTRRQKAWWSSVMHTCSKEQFKNGWWVRHLPGAACFKLVEIVVLWAQINRISVDRNVDWDIPKYCQ